MMAVIVTGGGHSKYRITYHHLIVTILVNKSTSCEGAAIYLAKIACNDRKRFCWSIRCDCKRSIFFLSLSLSL